MQNFGTLDVGNEIAGFVMLGSLRAAAGLSLGALTWYIFDRISCHELTSGAKRLACAVELIC